LDKSLCTINKALRTTVKAFLKKKAMEKETQRKKELATAKAAEATQAAEAASAVQDDEQVKPQPDGAVEGADVAAADVPREASTNPALDGEGTVELASTEAQMDIPRPSIEVK
jgi:hypothetical protein